MADRRVTITISAQDSFSSVMNRYKQQMSEAENVTQDFNSAGKQGAQGMDALTGAVGDAIKGFIAFKAVGMVADLVNLGTQANFTEQKFNALAGGSDKAANALNAMKEATKGVVDDTDLMAGATRDLQLGLATTADEAGKLTSLAANLGRVMGMDTSDAIQRFGNLLETNSTRGLVAFGLNVDAVKAKIAQLKAQGMDAREAFKLATLEEGRRQLEMLGPAADVGVTGLKKLEVQFNDLKEKAGQAMANILETALTTFSQIGDIISITYQQGKDQSHVQGGRITGSTSSAFRNYADVMAQREDETRRFQAYMNAQATQQIMQDQQRQAYAAYASRFNDPLAGFKRGLGVADTEQQQQRLTHLAETMKQFQDAQMKMTNFTGGASFIKSFMNDEDFANWKLSFKELQDMAAKGFISSDDMDKMKSIADQAQRANDAFHNMSLTDIFGQSSGGVKGQISDMVMSQLQKSGMKPEQLAAIQQQFDLGSGRETSASVAMKGQAAKIAQLAQIDPAQAQKAMDNMTTFLTEAAKLNLTPDQIAKALPGATGMTGQGIGSFTVKPGQTLSAIAAQLGIPVEALLAATGAPNARSVRPGTYNYGGGPVNPNFNPATYAQGYAGMLAYGGNNVFPAFGDLSPLMLPPQFQPFSTGRAGAGKTGPRNIYPQMPYVPGNPFVTNLFGYGGESMGKGEAEGADPFGKSKKTTDDIKDNLTDIKGQMTDVTGGADDFSKALDQAAKPRDLIFTVTTVDKTQGLLQLVLSDPGTKVTLQSAAAAKGSVRAGGGSPGTAGIDGRTSKKPGLTT